MALSANIIMGSLAFPCIKLSRGAATLQQAWLAEENLSVGEEAEAVRGGTVRRQVLSYISLSQLLIVNQF